MSRSLKAEIRHQKVLRKYSLRNAKESRGDLRDLFLSQCTRIEEKIKELRGLRKER